MIDHSKRSTMTVYIVIESEKDSDTVKRVYSTDEAASAFVTELYQDDDEHESFLQRHGITWRIAQFSLWES